MLALVKPLFKSQDYIAFEHAHWHNHVVLHKF